MRENNWNPSYFRVVQHGPIRLFEFSFWLYGGNALVRVVLLDFSRYSGVNIFELSEDTFVNLVHDFLHHYYFTSSSRAVQVHEPSMLSPSMVTE